jgi:hypothetical protein
MFHVFETSIFNKKDTVVLSVKRIFQFIRTSYSSAIIFDTIDSFNFVSVGDNCKGYNYTSKKHKIQKITPFNMPPYYIVKAISYDKIIISFWSMLTICDSFERVLLYRVINDELIQSLDVRLDE